MQKNETPNLSETARIEAFSDAVFAITITLLVLEIKRPNYEPGNLGHAHLSLWPDFFAFVISFLYMGVIWLNHHALFQTLTKVDKNFKLINLSILATSSLLPFPTAILARSFSEGNVDDQKIAVIFYSIIAAVMSATWLLAFPYIHRHPELHKEGISSGYFKRQISRPIIGIFLYSISALVGWLVGPKVGIFLIFCMILFHTITSEGISRTGNNSSNLQNKADAP